MITIRIDGLEQAINAIGNAGKQARFAAAKTLTRTAQKVGQRIERDMARTFDNPSRWIASKSTFVKQADKSTLTATVGVKDRQSLYVKEHFTAGVRGQKPYEKALTGMGVLPAGYKVVPGAGMKLDARGIPNRKQLAEIFGALRSRVGVYAKQGRGKKATAVLQGYFIVQAGGRGRMAPGVWMRHGRQIKPVMLFVRAAQYRKVLDLPKSAKEVVNQEFMRIFDAEFEQAMRSAR